MTEVLDVVSNPDELDDRVAEFNRYRTRVFLRPKSWNVTSPLIQEWETFEFNEANAPNIPTEPGLYAFSIINKNPIFPNNSYIMYIGKTKRALRTRYREYLREQKMVKRPRVSLALKRWDKALFFCCTPVNTSKKILGELEMMLVDAFIPPVNQSFSAEIKQIVIAWDL